MLYTRFLTFSSAFDVFNIGVNVCKSFIKSSGFSLVLIS